MQEGSAHDRRFVVLPRLLEPAAWAAPLAIVVAALLIRPVGEFPILDDFDYSATVEDLLRTGEIRLSDWPSMTLVGQVYWGATLAKFLHPFHLALRISTLALHAIGSLAAYCWLRGRGASPGRSAFAAIALATSPETLYFACTFMTDVPGLAWTLILLLAADRALESRMVGTALVAGILGGVGYLFRQTAVIPLVAAFLLAAGRGRLRIAASIAAPVLAVAVAHHLWLRNHGVPHHASIPMLNPAILSDVRELAIRAARITATVALYLTPAALLFWPSFRRSNSDRSALVRGLVTFLVGVMAAATTPAFVPYDGQAVFDMGLGADMSLDRSVFAGPTLAAFGRRISVFQTATTALAILSLALVAAAFPRFLRHDSPSGLLGLSFLGAVLFALVSGSFYERYLLPAWSLAILGLAAAAPTAARNRWGVLAAFATCGVLGTEDYFRRFGVVWNSLEEVRATVPLATINGGMEFAGQYRFNPLYRGKPQRVRPFLSSLSEADRVKLITPMVLDPYVYFRVAKPFAVVYVEDDSKTALKRYPYRSFLRRGVVHVLQRTLPPPAMGASP